MTSSSEVAGSYFQRLDEHRLRMESGRTAFQPPRWTHRARRPAARGCGGHSLLLSRISFDILGRLANDTCEISVETIRPGRTIELVSATLSIAGRPVIGARAWLLAAFDTASVAGGGGAALVPAAAIRSRFRA